MHIRPIPALVLLATTFTVSPLTAPARTFTLLHPLAVLNNGTNNDGALPYCALALSGQTLYGTTFNGGANSNGTVFAVNMDGSGFTNIYTFKARVGLLRTNSDGAQPVGGLVLVGNTLYGTTGAGGVVGRGTVFAINTDGSSFTNLHGFYGNGDGAATVAGLVASGNRLYGAAQGGGANGLGMIFTLNTDGSGYANLHSFATLSGNINNEGAQPVGAMAVSGTNLFGTCWNGGTGGEGAVFRINTDGTGYTNLHSFTALVSGTNADGAVPFGALTVSGDRVFGTTRSGGASGYGTLFWINTDGSGFTNFHNFSAVNNKTNSDGTSPFGGLFVSGNTLYGTAPTGGSVSNGTVFVVNTDGTGFRVLYNFSGTIGGTNTDGAQPVSGVLSSNTLYGVAHAGGDGGSGTIFSLFLPPVLTPGFDGAHAILTWPTNADGFVLQSADRLDAAADWTPVAPPPVNLNGQYTITNPISAAPIFYRLQR